jgi:hypothetical protein
VTYTVRRFRVIPLEHGTLFGPPFSVRPVFGPVSLSVQFRIELACFLIIGFRPRRIPLPRVSTGTIEIGQGQVGIEADRFIAVSDSALEIA